MIYRVRYDASVCSGNVRILKLETRTVEVSAEDERGAYRAAREIDPAFFRPRQVRCIG